MKKLMFVGLLFVAGIAKAACLGSSSFCWDETGSYVAGAINNGNGSALPQVAKASIKTTIPNAKGQEIWCPDCTNFNASLGETCVSTSTAAGGYMAISSATAVTACQ